MPLTPILLAAALAGARPAAPPQPTRDYDSPPPGSRADQALWKASYEGDNRIVTDRVHASRLQLRAKAGRYQDRLEVLARQRPDSSDRAQALRERLLAAWNASLETNARRWPVDPTRACRYPRLGFESALYSEEGAPRNAGELAVARQELQECVEKARLVLRALERTNRNLEGVLADLDRELAGIPVEPPQVGPRAASAGPQGAAGR